MRGWASMTSPSIQREAERLKSLTAARLERLKFTTPAWTRHALVSIAEMHDSGTVEIDVSRVNGELVIGVREKRNG